MYISMDGQNNLERVQWTIYNLSNCYWLKPRLALDTLLASHAVLKPISKDKYVEELVQYLRNVHACVAEQHTRVR